MEDITVIEGEPNVDAPIEGINIHKNDEEDGRNKNHLSSSDDEDGDGDEDEVHDPVAEVVIVENNNGGASINAPVVITTSTTDATGIEAQKKRDRKKRLNKLLLFARNYALAQVAFTPDNKEILSIGGGST